MAQVELRLASCYTESKAAALNDVLEEFFFDDGTFWEAAPLPTGVRDVTYEILATMVRGKLSTLPFIYNLSSYLLASMRAREAGASLLTCTVMSICTEAMK